MMYFFLKFLLTAIHVFSFNTKAAFFLFVVATNTFFCFFFFNLKLNQSILHARQEIPKAKEDKSSGGNGFYIILYAYVSIIYVLNLFLINADDLSKWNDSPAQQSRRVSITTGYFACPNLSSVMF